MARITVIPDDAWDGDLGELYPRVVDRTYGRVDNILAIHSLNLNPPIGGCVGVAASAKKAS